MDYRYKSLVEAGKTGDGSAQEALLYHLKPLMLSAVKRYGWGFDKEELLQEAAFIVLEGIRDFSPERGVPFLAYIRTHVYFGIYNLSRKQRVMDSLEASVDGTKDIRLIDLIPSTELSPDAAVLAHDELSALSIAVDALDVRLKSVIHHYFILGYTLKQTAVMMGTSYKTTLRLKDKALKILREKLK